jgi:hypothetical protein
VPAEHLLDFHDFIDRLEIVHEDVQIKLFKFSLEGIALDWCRSLPSASVSSLADFHAAFHVFCKNHFPDDLLYPQCCHEFYLLNKDPNTHEDFAAAEDISHHDQEMGGLQDDGHSIDALNSIPNASTILDCYADQIVPFENFKDDKQIDRSEIESFGSTTKVELPTCNIEISKGSSQLPDLQTKGSCPNHEEQDFQKTSNLQEGQPEDYISPYVLYMSTSNEKDEYDEVKGDIFSNLFQDPVADDSMQESSSLSLEIVLDVPIFDKYSDEEEDFKSCEGLFTTKISFSPMFQQRDDQRCMHVVVNNSYQDQILPPLKN